MPHFRITLAYDGTDFVGWQRQSSGTSIQGLIEDVLGALDGQPVSVAGAGRTDAGVHALGQVASFSLRRPLGVDAIVGALNARLPDAVRVLEAKEVEPGFHARFSARAKHYRYRIWNARVMQPQERRYAWHVPVPLDVHAMAAAARLLEGHHDLAAFRSAGGAAGRTERIISRSDRAYADVPGSVPLLIVGDAPYATDYKAQLARQAAADPRVSLTGALYGEAYTDLQRAAMAYIHATSVGGTHPALIEAMAAGNLVLAFGTPENREVTAGTALIFGDQVQLTDALTQVLAAPDSTEHQALRTAARKRAGIDLLVARNRRPVRGAHRCDVKGRPVLTRSTLSRGTQHGDRWPGRGVWSI